MTDDDDISAIHMLAERVKQISSQLTSSVGEVRKDVSDLKKKVDRLIIESAEAKGAQRLRNRALATLGTLVVVAGLILQLWTATHVGAK